MDIMTIISNAAGELIAPTTAAYVLAAIGLNIHFGMTGLMNMGQAGFMLLGAYGFAITQSMGCNLFASVCAALALAVIYALLLGIPTLKLGPDYLAMVTLAAAEIIRIIGRSTAMKNFTGGSAGISPQDFTEKFESLSPLPDGSTTFLLWTYSNNIANSWWLRIVAWVLVVIAALLCWRWFHSPWGRMLKGIREDENAIRSLGKPVTRYKMESLILGGLFGAIAGIIFVLPRSVQPDSLGRTVTFYVWTILLLGGAATILGPVLGSCVLWVLLTFVKEVMRNTVPETLISSNQIKALGWVIVGVALMCLVIFRPQGLLATERSWLSMPDTTNSPTTGVQPATQPATGVQPVSGVQPGVPFQDLTKWATKAPEGETLISTAYRDKVTDDLKFVENKPGVHKPDPILVADNVTRKFGGMTAVDVSHFEIERHGITALIGPNGAGKTTFFNLMTGFDTPNTGTWQFDGKDMAHVQPEKVARMGMVRTFQLTKVMSRLTVLDNMLLGAPVQPGEGMFRALFPGMWRKQEQANIEKAEALLERFLLIKKKDDYAGALSGGQRKLLEMARALMSDPKLVMLDEPMAGVNPALKQSLLDHIMALREEGTTVLFVEHDINMVRHIADWVTVMAEGKIVAEGQPKSVMNDPAVIDAYLGAHANVDLGDDSVLEDLKEA